MTEVVANAIETVKVSSNLIAEKPEATVEQTEATNVMLKKVNNRAN